MSSLFDTNPPQKNQPELSVPLVVGAGILLVLTAAVFLIHGAPRPTSAPDLYAASLKISDIKMSTANNFAGTSVTYIDGTIANTGSLTITAATVETTFRDSLGQIVQRDVLPLHVLKASNLYDDIVDLQKTPLAPGETKPFRLTFDHVSAQWAQSYPQIRPRSVTAK